MKTKTTLLGTALLGCVLALTAGATTELRDLRPLKRTGPVPVRVVNPTDIPAEYRNAFVKVSFTLNAAGQPQGIMMLGQDDPYLTECITSAFSQWRFNGALPADLVGEIRYVMPLHLVSDLDLPAIEGSMQVGSLKAIAFDEAPAAQPEGAPAPAMYHANAITRGGHPVVRDGSTEAQVRAALGHPQKVSGSLWVYAQGSGGCTPADRHGCDTILVTFQDGRVSAIALVNKLARKYVDNRVAVDADYVSRTLLPEHSATALAQN